MAIRFTTTREGTMSVRTVLLAAVLILTGCVTSHVLVGTPREPIAPDQVKIYIHPPTEFDEIAILDSSSRVSLAITAQGKTDKVLARLKDEAAKLGANGILLQAIENQAVGSIGTGFESATASGHSAVGFGFGSFAAVYEKSVSGMAIYVIKE
jgi:hypothetical protein